MLVEKEELEKVWGRG